jgi:hypothetical protein
MAGQLPVWVFPILPPQLRLEPHRPAKDEALCRRQWCTSHTSVGIQYPNGSNLLLTGERRIMTARVRRDPWEVASGPLR